MRLLPLLTPQHALFLDFDGTLVDIAPRPELVHVSTGLRSTLHVLQAQLQGAVAIVTGRTQAQIDHFLAPLQLPMASEHGAQYRLADGSSIAIATRDLSAVLQAAQHLAAQHPQLIVEHKRASVALHYRQAPYLEALCRDTLLHALEPLQGFELMRGKLVLEVKVQGVDKGQALRDLMTQAPFAGRTPVFAGDDVTDESGFAAVQQMGGAGIKVGSGPTLAHHRCMTPAALRGWLSCVRTDRETLR